MDDNSLVRIAKKRTVVTYVEFWGVSRFLLQEGVEREEGSLLNFMASLTYTAFSFEACLNHVGQEIFPDLAWKAIERLSPRSKLEVIAEKLELKLDFGRKPWSVMIDLFRFRDQIAHGKSEILEDTSEVPLVDHQEHAWTFTPAKWEKYRTREHAEDARAQVEEMVKLIHEKWGHPHHFPFVGGFQIASVTQVPTT
ncbi:hypothetical protein [Paludisphaera mucosa]|uniref:RiboL-PSP-HEPN domain-containing protein n=1 Tax=Paludisphaera mucosa TaxID=3030827 RepID=A0ABT6F4S8_9BACT|nr:hypothetical protein [Paludisphaera mucosa]MDG3002581.1 hypothetical protein [Paludisphaera mucosa]